MPGFLGVYRENADFRNDFSSCNRQDLINENVCTKSVYLERRTIDKFLNDKLFLETENLIIITEGVILNSKALIIKYQKSDFGKTVLEMIHQNPTDFFKEFRGSFSGVVYDKQNDSLQIYTDHTGSKYIFYTQTDKGFCFGSEINYLTEFYKNNDLKYSLDIDGAYLLLTFGFMQEDYTLFKEIKKLKPGHYLKYYKGTIKIIQYYQLNNTPNYKLTEEEIIDNIDVLFRKSVNLAFDKDKEYGYKHLVALSGGLDSRMTTWVANELGYGENIVSITFSQTNYWDEHTPKAISNELKNDWIFKSLDNGRCLKLIEPIVKITSGGSIYSSNSHSKSVLDLLNNQLFGIVHTGMITEAIISTIFSSLDINKPFNLSDGWPNSKVLLNKLNWNILKDTYENEEMYLLYNKVFTGASQGLSICQEILESYSPAYDVELINFCLTIPVELRFGHYIYYKWVTTKYPEAAKYPHNEGGKITSRKPHWIRIGNRYIKSSDLSKRAGKYFFKKIGLISSITTTKKHMNPMDYWYKNNSEIKDYMDSYFTTNINRLYEFPDLQKDCIDMYNNYTITEKAQVLTMLAVMKLYFK
jgi:asparagine synthase (glutamine-hydrolysing)